MKKTLIVIISILFNSLLYSQSKIGVFAGVNYSYFSDGFAKQINASNKYGLQFGILYDTDIIKNVNFRPKLNFSVQGDKNSELTSQYNLSEINHKLTYLNIPLDLKFWEEIYLLAGPQIGILLSQNKLSENSVIVKSKIDFGLNLGGGFKVNKLFFELGIYQGLRNVFSVPATQKEEDIRNGYLKFTTGYYF